MRIWLLLLVYVALWPPIFALLGRNPRGVTDYDYIRDTDESEHVSFEVGDEEETTVIHSQSAHSGFVNVSSKAFKSVLQLEIGIVRMESLMFEEKYVREMDDRLKVIEDLLGKFTGVDSAALRKSVIFAVSISKGPILTPMLTHVMEKLPKLDICKNKCSVEVGLISKLLVESRTIQTSTELQTLKVNFNKSDYLIDSFLTSLNNVQSSKCHNCDVIKPLLTTLKSNNFHEPTIPSKFTPATFNNLIHTVKIVSSQRKNFDVNLLTAMLKHLQASLDFYDSLKTVEAIFHRVPGYSSSDKRASKFFDTITYIIEHFPSDYHLKLVETKPSVLKVTEYLTQCIKISDKKSKLASKFGNLKKDLISAGKRYPEIVFNDNGESDLEIAYKGSNFIEFEAALHGIVKAEKGDLYDKDDLHHLYKELLNDIENGKNIVDNNSKANCNGSHSSLCHCVNDKFEILYKRLTKYIDETVKLHPGQALGITNVSSGTQGPIGVSPTNKNPYSTPQPNQITHSISPGPDKIKVSPTVPASVDNAAQIFAEIRFIRKHMHNKSLIPPKYSRKCGPCNSIDVIVKRIDDPLRKAIHTVEFPSNDNANLQIDNFTVVATKLVVKLEKVKPTKNAENIKDDVQELISNVKKLIGGSDLTSVEEKDSKEVTVPASPLPALLINGTKKPFVVGDKSKPTSFSPYTPTFPGPSDNAAQIFAELEFIRKHMHNKTLIPSQYSRKCGPCDSIDFIASRIDDPLRNAIQTVEFSSNDNANLQKDNFTVVATKLVVKLEKVKPTKNAENIKDDVQELITNVKKLIVGLDMTSVEEKDSKEVTVPASPLPALLLNGTKKPFVVGDKSKPTPFSPYTPTFPGPSDNAAQIFAELEFIRKHMHNKTLIPSKYSRKCGPCDSIDFIASRIDDPLRKAIHTVEFPSNDNANLQIDNFTVVATKLVVKLEKVRPTKNAENIKDDLQELIKNVKKLMVGSYMTSAEKSSEEEKDSKEVTVPSSPLPALLINGTKKPSLVVDKSKPTPFSPYTPTFPGPSDNAAQIFAELEFIRKHMHNKTLIPSKYSRKCGPCDSIDFIASRIDDPLRKAIQTVRFSSNDNANLQIDNFTVVATKLVVKLEKVRPTKNAENIKDDLQELIKNVKKLMVGSYMTSAEKSSEEEKDSKEVTVPSSPLPALLINGTKKPSLVVDKSKPTPFSPYTPTFPGPSDNAAQIFAELEFIRKHMHNKTLIPSKYSRKCGPCDSIDFIASRIDDPLRKAIQTVRFSSNDNANLQIDNFTVVATKLVVKLEKVTPTKNAENIKDDLQELISNVKKLIGGSDLTAATKIPGLVVDKTSVNLTSPNSTINITPTPFSPYIPTVPGPIDNAAPIFAELEFIRKHMHNKTLISPKYSRKCGPCKSIGVIVKRIDDPLRNAVQTLEFSQDDIANLQTDSFTAVVTKVIVKLQKVKSTKTPKNFKGDLKALITNLKKLIVGLAITSTPIPSKQKNETDENTKLHSTQNPNPLLPTRPAPIDNVKVIFTELEFIRKHMHNKTLIPSKYRHKCGPCDSIDFIASRIDDPLRNAIQTVEFSSNDNANLQKDNFTVVATKLVVKLEKVKPTKNAESIKDDVQELITNVKKLIGGSDLTSVEEKDSKEVTVPASPLPAIPFNGTKKPFVVGEKSKPTPFSPYTPTFPGSSDNAAQIFAELEFIRKHMHNKTLIPSKYRHKCGPCDSIDFIASRIDDPLRKAIQTMEFPSNDNANLQKDNFTVVATKLVVKLEKVKPTKNAENIKDDLQELISNVKKLIGGLDLTSEEEKDSTIKITPTPFPPYIPTVPVPSDNAAQIFAELEFIRKHMHNKTLIPSQYSRKCGPCNSIDIIASRIDDPLRKAIQTVEFPSNDNANLQKDNFTVVATKLIVKLEKVKPTKNAENIKDDVQELITNVKKLIGGLDLTSEEEKDSTIKITPTPFPPYIPTVPGPSDNAAQIFAELEFIRKHMHNKTLIPSQYSRKCGPCDSIDFIASRIDDPLRNAIQTVEFSSNDNANLQIDKITVVATKLVVKCSDTVEVLGQRFIESLHGGR